MPVLWSQKNYVKKLEKKNKLRGKIILIKIKRKKRNKEFRYYIQALFCFWKHKKKQFLSKKKSVVFFFLKNHKIFKVL